MKTIIGIDCGLEGALAVMWPEGPISFYDTPTLAANGKTKRAYDVPAMAALIERLVNESEDLAGAAPFFFIEKQQPMPTILKGSVSNFSVGYGYGLWLGMIGYAAYAFECIAPRTWKNVMLRDLDKAAKDASRLRARELFPECADELQRKKDHNRAEALLIAEYGRRVRLRQEAPVLTTALFDTEF